MARFAYTLYSLAVAHANDHAKPEDFVKVSGGLLLLYGFGTMIGPVHRRDADGLDAARKACSWRPRSRISCWPATRCCASSRRAPVPLEDREAFKTLPAERGVTPEAAAARSAHAAGAGELTSRRVEANHLDSQPVCRTKRHDPSPTPSWRLPIPTGAICWRSFGAARKPSTNLPPGCRCRARPFAASEGAARRRPGQRRGRRHQAHLCRQRRPAS